MKHYTVISQNKLFPSSGTDVVIYLTEETQYSTFYRQVSSSNSVQFSVHRDRWDGQRSSVTYTSFSMRVVWKWTSLWMGSSSILFYLSQMKAEHGLKHSVCTLAHTLSNNTHIVVGSVISELLHAVSEHGIEMWPNFVHAQVCVREWLDRQRR